MLGAVVYGLYGLVRAGSAGGILLLEKKSSDPAALVFGMSGRARRVTNVVLLIVGLSLLLAAGL
jgi:hypothetical protein